MRLARIVLLAFLIGVITTVSSSRPRRANADLPDVTNFCTANISYNTWYGIDGYINGGQGTLSSPTFGAILSFVTATDYSVSQWTQVGVYRGTVGSITGSGGCGVGCVRNLAAIPHVYSEWRRAA